MREKLPLSSETETVFSMDVSAMFTVTVFIPRPPSPNRRRYLMPLKENPPSQNLNIDATLSISLNERMLFSVESL